jgi:hypothetical protein
MGILKAKLKDIQDRHDQLVQQQQQQEMQQKQQEMQMQQQMAAATDKIREEDSIRKSDTMIQVALIQAGSAQKTEDRQPELDAINDQYMEQQKVDLQKQKLNTEKQRTDATAKLGDRVQTENERKNKVAEQQKAQEMDLKKKALASKPKQTTKK